MLVFFYPFSDNKNSTLYIVLDLSRKNNALYFILSIPVFISVQISQFAARLAEISRV